MAKRVVITPLVGSGTDDDPYRAAIHDNGVAYTAIIPSKADGTPRFAWAFCVSDNAAALDTDSRLASFPVGALGQPLSALLTNAQLTAIAGRLTGMGVSTAGITRNSTLRQALRIILDQLQPNLPDPTV